MSGTNGLKHCKRSAMAFAVLALLCSCSSEERQWRAATESNSAAAYQDFIAKYPDSKWLAAAEEKLNALYDWVPFVHLEGVTAGKSRRSDVTRLFGEPSRVERSFGGVVRMSDGQFRPFGNNLVITYEKVGLEFVISRKDADQPDPVVNTIGATPPYAGVAPNGVRLGMQKAAATASFAKSFVRDEKMSKDMTDFWLLRKDVAVTDGPVVFMILSYDKDVVSQIEMHRYTRIGGK
jgi:hypothetical protein